MLGAEVLVCPTDVDPEDPRWPLRDRFVLSNGHASMLQYALLYLYGVLSADDIAKFRNLGSRTPGHPEYGETPGIEVTTGPLGQGFGHAVGMALAGRLARSSFGKLDAGDHDPVDATEYVVSVRVEVKHADGGGQVGLYTREDKVA